MSDYSGDVSFSPEQLQSLMTQKGPLYHAVSILFKTCTKEDSKSSIVGNLQKIFNNPLFQASALRTFFKTAEYLTSIHVADEYSEQFGLANCEFINRIIDSKDAEKIQNVRIIVDNFITTLTNSETPSEEFIEHQLDILGVALSLNELEEDPAAAYQMDPVKKYHLSILDKCQLNQDLISADTLTQHPVYQRFLEAIDDYLDIIKINDAVLRNKTTRTILSILFAHSLENEKPLSAARDTDEELPSELPLVLNHFSENCLTGAVYEQLLKSTQKIESNQSLSTASLVNFGNVLNHLDKRIQRSYKDNEGILLPSPVVQQLFNAFHSLSEQETRVLSESVLLRVIEAYNHAFNNQAALVAIDQSSVKLLLTNPALCTLLLLLKEDQALLSQEKTRLENEILFLHYFSRLSTLLPNLLPEALKEDADKVKKLKQALAHTIAALVKNPDQVDFDTLLIKEFKQQKIESVGEQIRSYLLYIAEIAASEADFEQKNAMIVQLTSNDIKGKQFFNAMYTTRVSLDDIETRLRTESSTKTKPNLPDVMRTFENARKEVETKLLVRTYTILNEETKPTKTSIKASMSPLLKPILDAVPKEKYPWIKTSLTILVNSLSIILTLGAVNLGHKLTTGRFFFFSRPDPKKQLDVAADDLSDEISKDHEPRRPPG